MSDDNIIHLHQPIADAMVLEPDQILTANLGKFQQLVIAGYDQHGNIAVCSTHGSRDALWLLERAKLHIMLETD